MKFNAESDFDKFGGKEKNYFSLKEDGDVAYVNFLYNSLADVEGHCVHRVTPREGGFLHVECLRDYDSPLEDCPLCSSNVPDDRRLQSKIWIPLYNITTGRAEWWERGKSFWLNVFYPLMVSKETPFCKYTFKITRHGKAGDMSTTYDIVEDSSDESCQLSEFEIPDISEVVADKSFEELHHYVETRSFTPSALPMDSEQERVFRRGFSQNANSGGISRRGAERPRFD